MMPDRAIGDKAKPVPFSNFLGAAIRSALFDGS
jgi:hypothetical protein